MVTYITAQYRHVAVCSGLYPVRSQSLHGDYSSGCIESAMQPSSTEKSSRTTLHYVILNDSARDLVLPPLIGSYLTRQEFLGVLSGFNGAAVAFQYHCQKFQWRDGHFRNARRSLVYAHMRRLRTYDVIK